MAASSIADAQLPPVAIVDVFGLRGKVSERAVRDTAKIEPGADGMKVMMEAESTRAALRRLPFVADASVNYVCCEDKEGKSMVFIGIRESGSRTAAARSAPRGKIRLPDDVVAVGKDFDRAFDGMLGRKNFTENDAAGHTFYDDPEARPVQEKFPGIALRNRAVLRRVLRESGDVHHRQYAAQIIAYHPDKRRVVGDLLFAADDADSKVRNNATRALIIIAQYAMAHPDLKIKMPGTRFIPMLDSVDWTDRNKAIGLLDMLTVSPNRPLLARLKRDSLPSLTEMALWTNPGHAKSAFKVLGRVAGKSEAEIDRLWKSADRRIAVEGLVSEIRHSRKS